MVAPIFVFRKLFVFRARYVYRALRAQSALPPGPHETVEPISDPKHVKTATTAWRFCSEFSPGPGPDLTRPIFDSDHVSSAEAA